MTSRDRPLSPFLIYRLDYTMVLSFIHRVTGVLLTAGTVVLVSWLLALARGPDTYTRAAALFGSWYFRLLLLGWLFSFFYHLANGIRHLAWDLGYGFEKPRARMTGWIVVVATAAMTVGYVWLALACHGGLR
jgi:succinate dehydrogenase / fumarate reductase cytochrome b subunit